MIIGYFIRPGFIFFSIEPTVISTVLGSCLSVAIHDRKHGYGGMNHFVYPELDDGEAPTALYAKPAMVKLLKLFMDYGSSFKDLEAHIFGGAINQPDDKMILERRHKNIEVAEGLLFRFGIELEGRDFGGRQGRKILFNTATGELIVARVNRIRLSDWYPELESSYSYF